MNSCCLPPSVGPPGSRGPAGPTGPVGPQGPPGEIGGIALSASGGLVSSGTASFANANGVSFGLVGQTVTASVGAGVTPPALSAGTQSANTGTFSFANSGGLTFGMAGSQTITGDVGAIRTVSAGNGSSMGNIKRLDFSNAGGVSFGLSTAAGSTGTITGSVAAGATATGNVGALSAGTQSGSSGTFVLSNSNGLSFGMAGSATITGSYSTAVFSQSNGVTFGTAGSTVTASVAAGATATGNVGALSAGTQSGSSGTFILSNSGGITFGMAGSATVTGDVGAIRTVSAGNGSSMGDIKRLDFSNGNGVSFGLSTAAGSTATITASVAAGAAAPTGSFYDNMVSGGSSNIGTFAFAGVANSLKVSPLQALAFPFNITAATFMLDLSLEGSSATMSLPSSSTFSIGIYTSTGGTLSLLNSASVSFGFAATDANNSTAIFGKRFLTIHSSLWSSQPTFAMGSQYWIATNFASSLLLNQTGSIYGMVIYSTGSRNGTVGVADPASATLGFSPFYGAYSATTAGMPTSIANSELNKTTLAARGFIPHVVMANATGVSAF